MVNLIENFMTANDCYEIGARITVKGLMVHSTATPGIMAADWFTRWNKSNLKPGKCVHAFLDNKECVQYLPWHWRGWHAGGKANDTHIGIEWCEPKDLNDKEYFAAVWANGVEQYAILCKQFALTEKDIISHKEGYKLGIASNHGDPDHWWKLHGKTMDDFRADVAEAMKPKPIGKDVGEVLIPGDKGDSVKVLNYQLASLGYIAWKDRENDTFGASTLNALKKFQNDQRIPVTCVYDAATALQFAKILAIYYDRLKKNKML